jgi:thiosulfate dehydrogenase [quinone] large subunit
MVIRVSTDYQLRDPMVASVLFSDTRMSVVWLIARVWLGWLWLDDGRQKVTDSGWMDGGQALRASWEQAVGDPGRPGAVMTGGWYRDVIQYMLDHAWYDWCGKLIAVSEVVVGLALILGLLTGLAALVGALLTFNFLLAGAASVNPLAFVIALGLVVAWKIAGYIGLDAFVLPKLGAPWRPGLFWKRIRPGTRLNTA